MLSARGALGFMQMKDDVGFSNLLSLFDLSETVSGCLLTTCNFVGSQTFYSGSKLFGNIKSQNRC